MPINNEPRNDNFEESNGNIGLVEDNTDIEKVGNDINSAVSSIVDKKIRKKLLEELLGEVIICKDNQGRAYIIVDFGKKHPEIIKSQKGKERGASGTLAHALMMGDREGKLSESKDWQAILRNCSGYDLFEKEKEKLQPLLAEVIKKKDNKERAYLIVDFLRANPKLIEVKEEKERGASSTLAQALMMGDRECKLSESKDWQPIQMNCGAYDLFEKEKEKLQPLLAEVIEGKDNKERAYLIVDFLRANPDLIEVKEGKERGASGTLAQALMMGDRECKLSESKDWQPIQINCGAYDYALEYFPILEIDLQKIYPDLIQDILNEEVNICNEEKFYKEIMKRMLGIYGSGIKRIPKAELKSRGFPYRYREDPTIPISYGYFLGVRSSFIRELRKQNRFR